MTWTRAVIACLAIVAASAALGQESRTFHPYTVSQIAHAAPDDWHGLFLSHVETTGYITYKKHEADGDWHLRVCDAPDVKGMDKKHCIVAEIIPEIRLHVPDLGHKVKIDGIYRYDAENPGHHWAEIHPVTRISEFL